MRKGECKYGECARYVGNTSVPTGVPTTIRQEGRREKKKAPACVGASLRCTRSEAAVRAATACLQRRIKVIMKSYLRFEKEKGEFMTKDLISNDEIKAMEDYLKGYALSIKLLELDRYERQFFGYRDGEDGALGDTSMARARMFEVRHFIMAMENSEEKLLLYYHYIRGETVDKCAELLGISRSSGFRLKRRALMLAAEKRNGSRAVG